MLIIATVVILHTSGKRSPSCGLLGFVWIRDVLVIKLNLTGRNLVVTIHCWAKAKWESWELLGINLLSMETVSNATFVVISSVKNCEDQTLQSSFQPVIQLHYFQVSTSYIWKQNWRNNGSLTRARIAILDPGSLFKSLVDSVNVNGKTRGALGKPLGAEKRRKKFIPHAKVIGNRIQKASVRGELSKHRAKPGLSDSLLWLF